jgi:hypothetical protein
MRPFVHGTDDVHSFNRFLEIAGITDNAASSLASNSPASDSVYRYNCLNWPNKSK